MLSDSKYINQGKPGQIIKIFAEDGRITTIGQANKIPEFMLSDMALEVAEKEVALENEKLYGSKPNGFESNSL